MTGTFLDWAALVDNKTRIVGIEMRTADRMIVLFQFLQWGQARSLPVYLWNPGFQAIQRVLMEGDRLVLETTEWCIPTPETALPALLQAETDGIFLIEGLLQAREMPATLSYQLLNAYYQFSWERLQRNWVLLEEYLLLSQDLQPLIPVLEKKLPNRMQTQAMVMAGVGGIEAADKHQPEALAALCQACQGLPEGEIAIVLQRFRHVASCQAMSRAIVEYKQNKLKGGGIEFIAEPDAPKAGGLDLLAARLDVISTMLSPQVEKYGLKFPVGMVLWGPPGTGKSLSAKLTAKK